MTESASLTKVAPNYITDAAGGIWCLVSSPTRSTRIYYNGNMQSVTNVAFLLYDNHQVYYKDNSGGWHVWKNGAWSQASDPTAVVVATESPDGTTVTTVGPAIVDSTSASWTLVSSTSQGMQIAVDDNVDPVTHQVTMLYYVNHRVYQENTSGEWYYKTKSADTSWTQTSDPRTVSTPPPPPPPTTATPYGTSPPVNLPQIDPHTQPNVSPMGWQVGWFEDFTSASVVGTTGGYSGHGQLQLESGVWDVADIWGGYNKQSIGWPHNLTIVNDDQGRATIGQFAVTNTHNNGNSSLWDACGIRNSHVSAKWGLWEVNAKLGWPNGWGTAACPVGGIPLWISAVTEWPPEVDIMEQWGISQTQMSCNFHQKSPDAPQNNHGDMGINSSTGFHTYSMLLCPNYAAWYADGKRIGALYRSGVGTPVLNGLTGATGSGPNATNPNKGYYGNDAMWPLTGVFASIGGMSLTASQLPVYLWVDWIRFSVLNAT